MAKPFVEGLKSFNRCKKVGVHYYPINNPYKGDTHEYREWERGYNQGYFNNLEKVKKREQARAGS